MRRHYIFHGEVQGVGFRWRAKQAASLYNITGFVRNCYDGTVEMEAEGSEEAIDKMVQTLAQSRYIYIERTDVKTIPETHDNGFHIK